MAGLRPGRVNAREPEFDPLDFEVPRRVFAILAAEPGHEDLVKALRDPPRDGFPLQVLAARRGESVRTLTDWFHRTTGLELGELLCRSRLARVAVRARDTNEKLETVAVAEGFSDGSSLGRKFRARVGLSFVEYRSWARAKRAAAFLANGASGVARPATPRRGPGD
jgi:AraC-like DNA-binding protein